MITKLTHISPKNLLILPEIMEINDKFFTCILQILARWVGGLHGLAHYHWDQAKLNLIFKVQQTFPTFKFDHTKEVFDFNKTAMSISHMNRNLPDEGEDGHL